MEQLQKHAYLICLLAHTTAFSNVDTKIIPQHTAISSHYSCRQSPTTAHIRKRVFRSAPAPAPTHTRLLQRLCICREQKIKMFAAETAEKKNPCSPCALIGCLKHLHYANAYATSKAQSLHVTRLHFASVTDRFPIERYGNYWLHACLRDTLHTTISSNAWNCR
jgi:hypothetical protein